jgi:uncharacterized protein YecT (DUF1311 family)
MFELEIAGEIAALARRSFWDTRSVALFFNGISKLAWALGLAITAVLATGFTGYILFLYLISAVCFVACPCIGLGMAAGVTVLWGALFYYAFMVLAITWLVATLLVTVSFVCLAIDRTEAKKVSLNFGIHAVLLAALVHFDVVNKTKIMESKEFKNLFDSQKRDEFIAPTISDPASEKSEAPAAPAPKAQLVQPSFDCAKASTRAEKMVCGNSELATLDQELAMNYEKARDAAADKSELKNEQLAWLKTLKQCPDEACLAQSYQQRINELHGYFAGD